MSARKAFEKWEEKMAFKGLYGATYGREVPFFAGYRANRLTALERRVFEISLEWWKQHRPVGWSKKRHLENPCINAYTDTWSEKLAKCIGKALLLQREKESKRGR